MIYAKKKIAISKNTAQQTSQILANVKNLLSKNLIKFEKNSVLFYPEIWKDQNTAINWMKCIYIYCTIKKIIAPSAALYFKNIKNNEIIGTIINGNAKILITI